MIIRLLVIVIVITLPYLGYSQNPCKSYPMNGYTGSCELTVLFTTDSKYILTSDGMTLKKWDIHTKKVVDEITPFPYKLRSVTHNPRIITIENDKPDFDIVSKSIVDRQGKLLSRLNAAGKKTLQTLTSFSPDLDIFFSTDSSMATIVSDAGRGNFSASRINLATGALEKIGGTISYFFYIADSDLLWWSDSKKHFINILDIKTKANTATSTPWPVRKGHVISPDKKVILFPGDFETAAFDASSGAKLGVANLSSRQYQFSSDGSRYYQYDAGNTGQVNAVFELSRPDFASRKEIRTKWMDAIKRSDLTMLDAERKLMYYYTKESNADRYPFEVWAYDLQSEGRKDSISFRYKPNTEELATANKEQEIRARIGNHALSKLPEMKTPTVFDPVGGITQFIDGYTDDGMALIRTTYNDGTLVFLWSFPEGKPIAAFTDARKRDHIAASPIVTNVVSIYKSFLSPSGKLLGLNTGNGAKIYQDGVLKLEHEASIVTLLDEFALLSGEKNFFVLNIGNGAIQKIKSVNVFNTPIDTHYAPGKAFFLYEDKIGVFDPKSSPEVVYYANADAAKSGYMTDYKKEHGTAFVHSRVTGSKQLVPGFKPITAYNDNAFIQSQFVISSYPLEGFRLYDVASKRFICDNMLYSGWMEFDNVIYFQNLQQLLVTSKSPKYTSPNAKDEDPGASSFTLDVRTGEITPYLLTDSRAKFSKMMKDWNASRVTYNYSSCEFKASIYPAGNYLYAPDGKSEPLITLGYDCDLKKYVVLRRQLLHPRSNSTVKVSRPAAMTEEELRAGKYMVSDKGYHVCPACGGYPVGYVTERYSGWSDWEQKSLNIYLYTRKWETKTTQMEVVCNVCKGEAWVK